LTSRYANPALVSLAEGWILDRLTPPSRLFGANGLRTGPDGRVYVAQVAGSQISALDADTGELETIRRSPGRRACSQAWPPARTAPSTCPPMPRAASWLCARQRARVGRVRLPRLPGDQGHPRLRAV